MSTPRRTATEMANEIGRASGVITLAQLEAALLAYAAQECAPLRAALEGVKSALGDRLLAKGPLSKEYAHGVMREINAALAAQTAPAEAPPQAEIAAQAPETEPEEVAAMTRAVRAADEAFEQEGGSSRHWIRDHFVPELSKEGFTLRRCSFIVAREAKIAALRERAEKAEEVWDSTAKAMAIRINERDAARRDLNAANERIVELIRKAEKAETRTEDYRREVERRDEMLAAADAVGMDRARNEVAGEVERLRAEVEQLRAALADVVAYSATPGLPTLLDLALDRAREMLAEPGGAK